MARDSAKDANTLGQHLFYARKTTSWDVHEISGLGLTGFFGTKIPASPAPGKPVPPHGVLHKGLTEF
jgi:hypothetical protein